MIDHDTLAVVTVLIFFVLILPFIAIAVGAYFFAVAEVLGRIMDGSFRAMWQRRKEEKEGDKQ